MIRRKLDDLEEAIFLGRCFGAGLFLTKKGMLSFEWKSKLSDDQITELLDEKRDLSLNDVRTEAETERLKELNKILSFYDYTYKWSWLKKLRKRIGKTLMGNN